MTTTAIIGPPGSGKTLYLVMLGYIDSELGKRIISNFSLSFKHEKVDIYQMLEIIESDDIKPTTLLIQEASKWFDSRRSMRIENAVLSSLAGQQRKREMDIYYDDQYITRIDAGLRDITEKSYIANCVYKKGETTKIPLIFEYEEYQGYFKYPTNRTIRFPAFYMADFYGMYDTKERTMPLIK